MQIVAGGRPAHNPRSRGVGSTGECCILSPVAHGVFTVEPVSDVGSSGWYSVSEQTESR
jgi:hypothetical protein